MVPRTSTDTELSLSTRICTKSSSELQTAFTSHWNFKLGAVVGSDVCVGGTDVMVGGIGVRDGGTDVSVGVAAIGCTDVVGATPPALVVG